MAEGPVCRLEGFVYVYDNRSTEVVRKPERRTTIIDLSENGYVTNLIGREVDLEKVIYSYARGVGLVATDNEGFSLNINEFGSNS